MTGVRRQAPGTVLFVLAALTLSFQCAPAPGYTLSGSKWPTATTAMYVNIPGGNGQWNTAFEDAMTQWGQDTLFIYSIVKGQSADPCSNPNLNPRRNGVKFSTTDCGMSWA